MSSLRKLIQKGPPPDDISLPTAVVVEETNFDGSSRRITKYEENFPLVDKPVAHVSPIALFPIWHPKREPFRWIVLFIACMFSLGSYFAYDAVGVIQADLQEYFHISDSEFGLIYSVYSLPNIILPFFGGFILDLVGLPVGTTVTCALVTIGAFMVAVSVNFDSYYMMLAGRFIFGVGAETSYVAQNTICCVWFKDGSQLALAMGLTVSAGRLGSYFTFAVNASVVERYDDFRAALWLGAFFASLSLVAGIAYMIMHYSALHIIKGTSVQLDIPQSQPDIKLSEALKFKPVFWIASIVTCMYYSAIFPFQSTATNLLETTHNFSSVKAANYISILPLTSFLLSPVFGYILDRIARRVYFATLGMAVMIPAFALLMTPDWPPIISMIIIGLAFALVPAALWPCIPLLVEEKYIGTSFGLISGIVNAGLTLFYWLQGTLPTTGNKTAEVLLFTGLGAFGFVFCMSWVIIDWKMNNLCNAVDPKAPQIPVEQDSDDEREKENE